MATDTLPISDPDRLLQLIEPPSANGSVAELFGRANAALHAACARLLMVETIDDQAIRERWLREASKEASDLHKEADRLSAIIGGLLPVNECEDEQQDSYSNDWTIEADRAEGNWER